MKIINTSQSIGKGWSSITREASGSLYGPVATPHGYVIACSDSGLTRLEFIHDGKVHYRYIAQSIAIRYLATLAKRFAKEIATQP